MNTTPRFFRFCRRKDRNTGSARQERIKMNSNTTIQRASAEVIQNFIIESHRDFKHSETVLHGGT